MASSPSPASAPSANLWVLLALGVAGAVIAVHQSFFRRRAAAKRPDGGAFVSRLELEPPPQPPPPNARHPLTGLSFAVADLFDISGYVAGFGIPEWAHTHDPAAQTSPIILSLVNGGATCVGTTVIDEMAYSLSGYNKNFGTPTNPAAPERVPGGCSSGSAVAVASGIVDFALGVDSIGGVRIPGGFCGILGYRPSHGVVSNAGIIPVAPSLDTVGWFAKDPNVLRRVGHLLLQLPYAEIRQPRRFLIAEDCFDLLKIPSRRLTQVLKKSVENLFGKQVLTHMSLGDYLEKQVTSLKEFGSGTRNSNFKFLSIAALTDAMQSLYKLEFREHHHEWSDLVRPSIDSHILNGLASNNDVNEERCQDVRNRARQALNNLLKDDGVLVIPTVLGPPPKLNSRELSSERYYYETTCLSSIASMSGCCEVTIPIGTHEKCPLSVSLIARHGGDRFLLDTAQSIYATLQEQAQDYIKSDMPNKHTKNEESAEIAKEKGNNAFREKQWHKAISFYSEAIKLNDQVATYYSNRAAAYLELKSFHQAETDCTNAINFDSKNVKAYLRRGTAREMLGYYKEAADDFNYALVLEPTNKTASAAVGRLKKLFS